MNLRTALALALLAAPALAQDLLVSSRFTDQILRYDGTTGAFVGVFAEGGGLENPVGLTFGPDGDLYVASGDNDRVIVYDGATGAFVRTLVQGGPVSGPRNLNFGPDGDLYLANAADNRILRFAIDGTFLGPFAKGGGLAGPTSFTFGPDGDLFVVSVNTNVVLRYDGQTGQSLGVFASEKLSGPHDVAFGPDGLVYVSNAFGNGDKVVRFRTDGQLEDVFIDGPALVNPLGLTWTRDARLLVVNQGKDEVRRFDARTGKLVDKLVSAGSGGLDGPLFVALMPETRELELWPTDPGIAGESNAFAITGARPGALIALRAGTTVDPVPLPGCGPTGPGGRAGSRAGVRAGRLLGRLMADESGNALFLLDVPRRLTGEAVLFEAVSPAHCETSRVVSTTFR